MIHFQVPRFEKQHREQLRSLCAVAPSFASEKDFFFYLPVDAIYTSGNGLPSFVVEDGFNNDYLLTIGEDSDVIFSHWHLASYLHAFIRQHKQKWLNKLNQHSLPILQHTIIDGGKTYPITGLNSLLLTLFNMERGLSGNVWKAVKSGDDTSNTIFLSSYIHRMDEGMISKTNYDDYKCPHPSLFLDLHSDYQQHVYAGLNIMPYGKTSQSFCHRLPFKMLGMKYTPSSWTYVLINKLSHFKTFHAATEVARKHPDLFSALLVCSAGFPANLLFDYFDYCSLVSESSYSLCELLVVISPLVDYCTTLMTDSAQIQNSISFFVDEYNKDFL